MPLRFLLLLFVIALTGCAEPDRQVAGPAHRDIHAPKRPERPVAVPDEIEETTGVVTLERALELALRNNPGLRASSCNIGAAEANLLQAALRPNPELQVEVEEAGGAGNRSGFDGAETTIAIAQPIETGNKRAKRKALASLDKELAEWDHKAARLDVAREVTGAFGAVLAWQQRLELAEDVVRIAERAHNAVVQRVEAGKDSPIEQTRSSVSLSTARIEPQRARRALESARRRLAATWGSKVAVFDSVEGQLDKIAPVASSAELSRLIQHNPDVARWDAELQRSRAVLELEKAMAVSDIELEGGLQHFNETDDSAVVFGLSIPLAVSDRNQGGIRRATYLLARTEQNAKASEIKALASLEEAVQRLTAACAEATALKDEVLPGAKSSFDAVSEGYRDGKFDYLPVLDAQRTLVRAKGRYIDSLAACHEARADVERLIGQNLDGAENALGKNPRQPNGRTQ